MQISKKKFNEMKKKLHSFIVLISLSINKSNQSVLLSLKVVVWREINGVSVMLHWFHSLLHSSEMS